MYPDKLEEENAAAPSNEPEHPPSPEEQQPSSPDHDRAPRHGHGHGHVRPAVTGIMHVLPIDDRKRYLLTAFDAISGFSVQLFNLVTNGEPFPISTGTGLCTTNFRTSRVFTFGARPYQLFDSPGFHTQSLTDYDILRKMASLLVKPRNPYHYRNPPKLSGILYLHPEDHDAGEDRLKETMESLRRFVGDPWLPSVTIAVIGKADSDSIAQLKEPSSAFYPLHSRGANIVPLSLEVPKIQELLSGFEPSVPSQLRLFQNVRLNHAGQLVGLNGFLEEITTFRGKESTTSAERPRKLTFEESETSRQQLQVALDETENELKSLRSQLDQTQQEYASLRSELQLNDNTEQSKIVQSLQDLNRAIDDFGRSVAEHMVDNFASSFKKDGPTTLDASDFPELQRQFGHQEGKSSLAASTTGEGLPIEDLIDLALRNFLCQKLYKDVFVPFHPTLTTSAEPGFMASLYEGVRSQSTPIAAAKWRASSFMALSKGNKLDKPIIEEQVESLVSGDIQQMLNNLFGQSNPATLTDNQRIQLQGVITQAWELNHVLKGEVVTLGDFQPLYYEREAPFDSKTMIEFEANKKRKPGDVAICTIRLGLTLSHSKGVGKDVHPLVVCPATVVTPTLYT